MENPSSSAENLSSSATFLHKFIFLPLWCLAWGAGTLQRWASPHADNDQSRWVFALAGIGGALFFWVTCARLKQVSLSGSDLIVSNFLTQEVVPLSNIASLRQNVALSMKTIVVTFRSDTRFGRAIVFMPPMSFKILAEDDIVGRLRSLAQAAGRQPAVEPR